MLQKISSLDKKTRFIIFFFLQKRLPNRKILSRQRIWTPKLPTEGKPRPVRGRKHHLMNFLVDPLVHQRHIILHGGHERDHVALQLLGRKPQLADAQPHHAAFLAVVGGARHGRDRVSRVPHHRAHLRARHQPLRPQDPPHPGRFVQLRAAVAVAQQSVELDRLLLDPRDQVVFAHE